MKRSEINRIMQEAKTFLAEHRFYLPPFAFRREQDWRAAGDECRELMTCALGWDITDFGGGRFAELGLFLFTLRNGTVEEAGKKGKNYAEKIMIVREGQLTPTHFHFSKMEDIINRGGGNLLLRVWMASETEELADDAIEVEIDGVRQRLAAGSEVCLKPGQSICLEPRMYHCFWGEKGGGTVLVGEVSRVNDDYTDNRFLEPIGRFPEIEEDEPPLHLLTTDYVRIVQDDR